MLYWPRPYRLAISGCKVPDTLYTKVATSHNPSDELSGIESDKFLLFYAVTLSCQIKTAVGSIIVKNEIKHIDRVYF